MSSMVPLCLDATRQFQAAVSAQAHSQRTSQNLMRTPELAVMAQANLDLQTVLDLLRD